MVEQKLLIFAGTTEGRELAEFIDGLGILAHVCTATEYGETLLPQGRTITTSGRRLGEEEMIEWMEKENFSLVVDATHPYAALATKNIQKACKCCQVEYVRLLRESKRLESEQNKDDMVIWVDTIEDAISYLKETDGIILAATGSKELHKYKELPNYQERVFARVLSTVDAMNICQKLGFQGKNLLCMQGPFHEEFNYALLKQIHASYMVTKESGKTGGFLEKINASKRAGVKTIVVGRQVEETGVSIEEMKKIICEKFNIQNECIPSFLLNLSKNQNMTENGDCSENQKMQQIYLVGIGMGTKKGMTLKAWEICKHADVFIGADRMLKVVEEFHKPIYKEYRYQEITKFIKSHPEYDTIVILFSGDVGFYSGAKKILDALKEIPIPEENIHTVSGISSVVYFCNKLNIPWENVALRSIHGRYQNLIHAVKTNQRVFSLAGKQEEIHDLCRQLIEYGMSDVKIYIGEELSYETEKITIGNPETILQHVCLPLSVILIENPNANHMLSYGRNDEAFIRDQVPMTKSEVRSISISKLKLQEDCVVYDIGAGTGSVSIEIASLVSSGMVYAVEHKEKAIALIEKNIQKFGVSNVSVINKTAPDGLDSLPMPTHVFIGGSSGNLDSIIRQVIWKNPSVRVVINAISLETLTETLQVIKKYQITDAEIVNVTISKSKELGKYHMMMGQNPVYIISFDAGGKSLDQNLECMSCTEE